MAESSSTLYKEYSKMIVNRLVLFTVILLSNYLTFAQYISRGAAKNRMNDTLPEYVGKIPFKMYSGYLKASENHFLHYWFVHLGNVSTKRV